MAGRFLFRKLSSVTSRSGSLLGAHALASARAGAPATNTASASRSSNSFSCSSSSAADAKTIWSTTGILLPSTMINRNKSAIMVSVRGANRTFSSGGASKAQELSWRARVADWRKANKQTWEYLIYDSPMATPLVLSIYAYALYPLSPSTIFVMLVLLQPPR